MNLTPIPKHLLIHSGQIKRTAQGSDPFQPNITTVWILNYIRVDLPTKGLTINVDGAFKTFSGRLFYDRVNSISQKVDTSSIDLEIQEGDTFVFNKNNYKVASVTKVYALDDLYHHLEVLLV